jgi:hypothetical protein
VPSCLRVRLRCSGGGKTLGTKRQRAACTPKIQHGVNSHEDTKTQRKGGMELWLGFMEPACEVGAAKVPERAWFASCLRVRLRVFGGGKTLGDKAAEGCPHSKTPGLWSAVALHRFSGIPRTTYLQIFGNSERPHPNPKPNRSYLRVFGASLNAGVGTKRQRAARTPKRPDQLVVGFR